MIEGKVVNQLPRRKLDGHICGNCSCIVPSPKKDLIRGVDETSVHFIYHYLANPEDTLHRLFIYETKSGLAIVYCSDRCRRAHNHRFAKKNGSHRVKKIAEQISNDLRLGLQSFVGEKLK